MNIINFTPTPKTEELLRKYEELGLNVDELINRYIHDHWLEIITSLNDKKPGRIMARRGGGQ